MTALQERTLKPFVSITVIFLVVVGLYFVVRNLPLEALGEIRRKNLEWWTLPVVAVLQVAFLIAAAEIWRQLVRVSVKSEITLWNAYLQLSIVAIGKYVPGKVWGFVARTGEMYRQNIPVHQSMMTSVTEQLLLMTGALLVVVVTAVIALPQYWVYIIAAGTALLFLAILMSVNIPALTLWLMRRRNMQEIPDQISGYHLSEMFNFVIGYAALWVLSGFIFSVIYFSLFDVEWSLDIVAVLTLANTIGIVLGFFAIFIPGGIGVREAVATGVLAGFLPVREALLAAVCYRAWMILIDGLNSLLIIGREVRLSRSDSS